MDSTFYLSWITIRMTSQAGFLTNPRTPGSVLRIPPDDGKGADAIYPVDP